MEKIVNDFFRLFDSMARAGGSCSVETWGVIAVCVVIGGYFLLKGNPVRGG